MWNLNRSKRVISWSAACPQTYWPVRPSKSRALNLTARCAGTFCKTGSWLIPGPLGPRELAVFSLRARNSEITTDSRSIFSPTTAPHMMVQARPCKPRVLTHSERSLRRRLRKMGRGRVPEPQRLQRWKASQPSSYTRYTASAKRAGHLERQPPLVLMTSSCWIPPLIS